jgi:hypothetical protein
LSLCLIKNITKIHGIKRPDKNARIRLPATKQTTSIRYKTVLNWVKAIKYQILICKIPISQYFHQSRKCHGFLRSFHPDFKPNTKSAKTIGRKCRISLICKNGQPFKTTNTKGTL